MHTNQDTNTKHTNPNNLHTNGTTTTKTSSPAHLIRRSAAAIVLVAMLLSLLFSSAASAQEAAPQNAEASSVQYAAGVVGPSTVYLESAWSIWVIDENGRYLNDGAAYEFSSRCSGFAVQSDGYIATAGHCVDPDEAIGSALEAAVIAETQAGNYSFPDGTPVTAAQLFEFASLNWTTEGIDVGEKPEPSVAVALGAGGGNQDVLPARILDYTGVPEGDWALLKVNAQDLPVVALADNDNIHIGTEIVSVGFPASSDQVVDASGPTFKDGRINSEKTRGNGLLPVYEISAAVSGGMSGGPTVDLSGEVVGVNSFGIRGEEQQFNFISPVSLLKEMLARNGVVSELTSTDHDYRNGVASLLTGDCTNAVKLFEAVTIQWPNHRTAADYLNDARKCVADSPAVTTIETGTTGADENTEMPEGTTQPNSASTLDADQSVELPQATNTADAPAAQAAELVAMPVTEPAAEQGGGLPIGLLAGVGIGLAGLGAGVATRRKSPAAPMAGFPAPDTDARIEVMPHS